MKILTVVRGLPAHRLGGLEFHTLDLCKALAVRGHDVSILTTPLPPGVNTPELPEGIRVHYMAQGDPGNYSTAFFRNTEKLIGKLDAHEHFDVIHTQEFAGMFVGGITERIACTIHGTMFSETPLDRRYFAHLAAVEKLHALVRFKARLVLHPFFKRMLRRAWRLIVDSEYTRNELLRIVEQAAARIRIVPLGIDPDRYPHVDAPRNEAGVPVVALLGRLQGMKGIGIALAAAEQLRDRGVSFRMRIGGSGEYEGTLCRAILDKNLGTVVEYSGRIPQEQIPDFYTSADLLLFPDLTQPAFGLVAVEAMAYGLPVVAARSGAIPEVVTEQVGWLYEPWSVSGLAGVLEEAVTDKEARRSRSIAARTRASQFTSDIMAEKFEQALDLSTGRL